MTAHGYCTSCGDGPGPLEGNRCPECRKCSVCGQPVEGAYTMHAECYDERTREEFYGGTTSSQRARYLADHEDKRRLA